MILDLQKRLVEVGRIRMGATVNAAGGKTRPAKLDKWRLTSRDLPRLEAAAQVYGGTPQPWDRQEGVHVLDTDTDNLRIMLLPGQTISQFFELWSGGGCVRRCNGREEMISGEPCMCPDEYTERSDLAKDGKACKPTTRLSMLLPDVAGIGCWRLETHGYYAAVELAGTADLLEAATRGGVLFPARLRIDQRSQLKGGKTTRYAVPVIDIDVRPDEVLALANGGEVVEFKALPQTAGTTVDAGLRAAAALREPPSLVRGNAAEPVGIAAPPPPGGAIAVDDGETTWEGEPLTKTAPVNVGDMGQVDETTSVFKPPPIPTPATINHAQLKLLWATIRGLGVSDDQVRKILRDKTGQESTKAIPPDKFEAVLNAVTALEKKPAAEAGIQPMLDDGTLQEVE